MAQFDRVYKLTIGVQGSDGIIIETGSQAEALNISFDIDKDLTQQTNKSNIKIYNLATSTINKIERPDSICIMEVGYGEDIGLRRIFVGYITDAWTHKEGTETITELELSDGQVPIRDCVVSLSYADSVSRKKVIDDVAAAMGIMVRYAEGLVFNTFANGFSFIGSGRNCLDKACAGTGLSWSIQNNVLQIIEQGGSTKVEAIKLNVESGLVGSPERIIKGVKRINKQEERKLKKTKADKKAGWRIRCLLQPTLNPGDLVYIESIAITGWFKIESLKHRGEYRGNQWYTIMEVYEIGGDTA